VVTAKQGKEVLASVEVETPASQRTVVTVEEEDTTRKGDEL